MPASPPQNASCWAIIGKSCCWTAVFGVPHGELSDFQLEWLEHQLNAEPERYTLLLLHHHPLPAGCSWLDQHSLRNAGALDHILSNYPRVKHLLCGHIHRGWISTGTGGG